VENITAVTTFRNTATALALMWETFSFHHPGYSWIAIDDQSSDGAGDYAKGKAARLIVNDRHINFGGNLDTLSNLVETEYTLTIDSDIEVLRPTVPAMLSTLESNPDALCVADVHVTGECDYKGYPFTGTAKIDHSFALFRTEKLKKLVGQFTWAPYHCFPTHTYYDGGAMILRGANVAGYPVLPCRDLWRNVVHYGGCSALFWHDIAESTRSALAKKYEFIGGRLKRFREGHRDARGLRFNGKTWSCGF
jgi:hypothetical protein